MIPISYLPMVWTIYFAVWLVIAYKEDEKSPGYDPNMICDAAGLTMGFFLGFIIINLFFFAY